MKICPRCSRPLGAGPARSQLGAADTWACTSCGHEPPTFADVPLLAPDVADGFDPASFDRLADTEAGSFWFRQRNALIVETLRRYAPDASSFLEIGCGNGYVLKALHDAFPTLEVAGAELHPQGLAHARRRLATVPLLQLDARRLPFVEEFDTIGAFDVLEHIDDDRGAIASIHAALKEGGLLLVTVPQHPWLWSAADEAAQHQRRYTRSVLRTRLVAEGFEILLTSSFVSSLLPLMAASRLAERTRSRPYDEMTEHRASERFGAFLERPLMIERALIRRGVSLPAGGSLLAVARRGTTR
ncbi:MAG: class I SAM-dependent methyltransferase [Actinobacteria bacterium]|nr:class I SAM-dependent methyltransferase [Actinomycetota bacterium]